MASRETRALATTIAAVILAGCGGSLRRFPLRAPLWKDTDMEPVRVACRPDPKPPKDDAGHLLCTPAPYESSFAWDGADNMFFRPISSFFAVAPGGEALNVNTVDEVPDSSWFMNRIGLGPMTPRGIADGSCGDRVLDPEAADGSWIIDQGKIDGANPGFRVNVEGLGKFMLKADPPGQPERATGAAAIASRFYHGAGWWAPCDSVVYFRRAILTLTPGLTVTDNGKVTRPFDAAALASLLAGAQHRGELVRMGASRWLPGRTIGPFRYQGTRRDDPSDVVNHEDRRDLRGARLMAAWLGHFDSREQNTMSTWMAVNAKDRDSSPGYVGHWYLDLGDCFGSEWAWEPMSKRLNYSGYFDLPDIAQDFVTLGIPVRPWDRARRSPEGAIFGFFRSNDFDPEAWKGGYPNPAFERMTERDGAWAARIIARFRREHLEAAVHVGDYSDPRHEPFLVGHLLERQKRILKRYFAKVSPVSDLRVGDDALCGVDLARRTGTFSPDRFRYSASAFAGSALAESLLSATPAEEGRVCVALTHIAPDGGPRDDDPARYLYVDLHNGSAPGGLRAHLYDLGPRRGFRLVGLER